MEGEEGRSKTESVILECDELTMIRSTRDMKIPPRKPNRESAKTMIPDTRRMAALETLLSPVMTS